MFENTLYTIIQFQKSDKQIHAIIKLNPKHEIFEGHFPQNPILPGVCTMQIVKEICSKAIERQLIMKKGDNLKFTSIIIPDSQKEITIAITILSQTEESLSVNAEVVCENIVSFKMKASYQCLPTSN